MSATCFSSAAIIVAKSQTIDLIATGAGSPVAEASAFGDGSGGVGRIAAEGVLLVDAGCLSMLGSSFTVGPNETFCTKRSLGFTNRPTPRQRRYATLTPRRRRTCAYPTWS